MELTTSINHSNSNVYSSYSSVAVIATATFTTLSLCVGCPSLLKPLQLHNMFEITSHAML